MKIPKYKNLFIFLFFFILIPSPIFSQIFFYPDIKITKNELVLDIKIDGKNLYILTAGKIYLYKIDFSQIDLIKTIEIPKTTKKRGIAGKLSIPDSPHPTLSPEGRGYNEGNNADTKSATTSPSIKGDEGGEKSISPPSIEEDNHSPSPLSKEGSPYSPPFNKGGIKGGLYVSLNYYKNVILVSGENYSDAKGVYFPVTSTISSVVEGFMPSPKSLLSPPFSNFEDSVIELKSTWVPDKFSLSGSDSFFTIKKLNQKEVSLPFSIPTDYYDACFANKGDEKLLIISDEDGYLKQYNMVGELLSITPNSYGIGLLCEDIDKDGTDELITSSNEDKTDKIVILKIGEMDSRLRGNDKRVWESERVEGQILGLCSDNIIPPESPLYKRGVRGDFPTEVNEIFGILRRTDNTYKLFSIRI